MKNGWKTSEFWMALAGVAIQVANTKFRMGIPEEAYWVIISYIIGRSGIKAANGKK